MIIVISVLLFFFEGGGGCNPCRLVVLTFTGAAVLYATVPSPPRPAIETTISEITLALTEIWKDKSGKERTIIKSSGRDTEYWEFFSSAHHHLRGNL